MSGIADTIKKESKSYFGSLARLLREAEEVEEKGEDSIDSQIDKYLTDYESQAKSPKKESRVRTYFSRFLKEAEGDEEEKEEKEDEGEGDEESKDEDAEEKKLTSEDIDLGSFSSDVMRLVENYDSLIEVRNTILRRASNFLAKNYEKDVVDSFKEVLLDSHGVEIGKSEKEKEEEDQAPSAGFAGPMGGGA